MSSHLSDTLKDLIRSKDEPTSSDNSALCALFDRTRSSYQGVGAGPQVWLLIMTGALFTLNAPGAIPVLLDFALDQKDLQRAGTEALSTSGISETDPGVFTAGLMREAGLKTISFNGVPKIIECLKALSQGINAHPEISRALPTRARREVTTDNLGDVDKRGEGLWDAVYDPLSSKLLHILGKSHPDLPGHILHSHYSALLSPVSPALSLPWDVDGALLSILAITCLRAQGGVAPQVESHVRGLLKKESGGFMSTEEGCVWLLKAVDDFVDGVRRLSVI